MGRDSESAGDAERLLDTLSASWKTDVLYVAARIGIADLLHDSPRRAAELASATGTHPAALARLLRALATIEIVREREDGRYELTPMGSLLRDDAADSLHAWVLHWGGTAWPAWRHLQHSIATGESARELVSGVAGFGHLAADHEARRTFHRAMAELTRLIGADFVAAVDWRGTRRIVDVGGGRGELLATALVACPGATGILFDEAAAIEEGRLHLRAAGLEHRCDFVAGSFFDRLPGGADTYLVKSVLHDWDDERAASILASCRGALGPGARLLLVERVVPQRLSASRDDQALACMDLHMLLQHGGRERSEAELRGLLASAALDTVSVTPLRSTLALVEAVPASAGA